MWLCISSNRQSAHTDVRLRRTRRPSVPMQVVTRPKIVTIPVQPPPKVVVRTHTVNEYVDNTHFDCTEGTWWHGFRVATCDDVIVDQQV